MIQWHPGEFSYWTADNIKSVNSSGLESSFSLDYNFNKLITSFNAGYSYTKATTSGSHSSNESSIGKQLMYAPVNQANCSFRMNYRMFYTSWLITMTGRRYITVDNSGFLPGYMLNNIIAGIKLNLKGNSLELNFHVDNLFNVNYQTIAYYPLPGRSYSLKLLILISK
jgi:iron complex outermembrane receptor protein